MDAEDVLALDARRRLFRTVEAHPGLHARELERVTGMPLSTLRYHLAFLERHGLVDSREDGAFRRYYARHLVGRHDKPVIGVLRRERPREVLLFILAQPGASAWHRDLVERFADLPASTLAEHLQLLVRRGVVERRPVGRESRYEVRDAERVLRLLHAYRASFLSELAEHVVDIVYSDEDRA